MNTLENLDILEDKVHLLTLRFTQTFEENTQLREQLEKMQRNYDDLLTKHTALKDENKKLERIKHNVKRKIEGLIDQLSNGRDLDTEVFRPPTHSQNNLTLEETEALTSPFSENILSDTTINFLPDEDI